MFQSATTQLRVMQLQLIVMNKVKWKMLQHLSDIFLVRSTSRTLKEEMPVVFARQHASILQLNLFVPSTVADNKIQLLTKTSHPAATPS